MRFLRAIPAALLVAAAVAGAFALAGDARADPLPEGAPRRTTGLAVAHGQLVASVGLQDLFGPTERERLTSGFATRVLIRVALEEEGSDEPVAVAYQRTEIVYDIWDEKFRLRVTRGKGPEVHLEARTVDEAVGSAATLWQFPITEARRLHQGHAYALVVRGDLNPISEELLTDVRRWILEPGRGGGRVRAGDTFFGSFVSIFVNPRIEDSERQVRFWSQPFSAPPAAPAAPPASPATPPPGKATARPGGAP